MVIEPHLYLYPSNHFGPIPNGFTVNEGDQILRVISSERFLSNYVYNVEVDSKEEDSVITTSKKSVRFNMNLAYFRDKRIKNGPFPYVTREWNGDISVYYKKGSETYNSEGKLLVTCNLSGAHQPMYVPKKAKSVVIRVEKAIKSLQSDPAEKRKQIEVQTQQAKVHVDELILLNPQPVQEYRAGKKTAINGCMGLVMKQNKALNPQVVRELLEKHL